MAPIRTRSHVSLNRKASMAVGHFAGAAYLASSNTPIEEVHYTREAGVLYERREQSWYLPYLPNLTYFLALIGRRVKRPAFMYC